MIPFSEASPQRQWRAFLDQAHIACSVLPLISMTANYPSLYQLRGLAMTAPFFQFPDIYLYTLGALLLFLEACEEKWMTIPPRRLCTFLTHILNVQPPKALHSQSGAIQQLQYRFFRLAPSLACHSSLEREVYQRLLRSFFLYKAL